MDKKNNPVIRFHNYKELWEYDRLKNIFRTIRNAFVGTATPYYVEKGHFYLESNNVKNGKINYNSQIFINDEFYEKQRDKWLKTNDIVMVQSGHVGHTAVIPEELDNTAAHALIVFTDYNKEVNPHFLNYQFQSNSKRKELDLISTGNTIKHILASEMKSFKMDLPTIEEQTAIGSLFRTLDDLLASYKENLANYQSLKATMLTKMFPKAGQTIPEIRLDGFEGEWKIKRADEIFKSVSEKNRALLPVLSASQIDGMVLRDEIGIDIKYDEAALNNYKVVKPGQFVIHLRSFQGGFALSKLEGITSPAYTIIDFIDKKNNIPDFWNSILTSRDFIKRLETVTYGIRDGKSISFKDFSSLKFVYPELEEQQATGSYFANLENVIAAHREKITQLETLKKKLLQDMFI